MLETMLRTEEVDIDFDDIDWELSCSAREAGVGYAGIADAHRAPAISNLSRTGSGTWPWAARRSPPTVR